MYYAQVLRVTRGLICLGVVLAVLFVLIVLIAGANGVFQASAHASGDNAVPLPALFALAGFIAAIFGSRYGRTLSEENEAHLAVAWTKPVSRTRYALTVMAVDAAAIVAAFGITLLMIWALLATFGVTRLIEITPDSRLELLRYLAFPLAFYGLVTAVTASVGKVGGTFVGFTWGATMLLALLGKSGLPHPWNAIFDTLNFINPMLYATYSHTVGNNTINVMTVGPSGSALPALAFDLVALVLIGVAGLAAGIWQWRRLEA